MKINTLIGIWQDGSNPGPGMPPDNRRQILIPLGDALVANLPVVLPSGAPANLASATFTWSIKRYAADLSPLLQVAGVLLPAVGPNWIQFTTQGITRAAGFLPGRYVYDVTMVDVAGTYGVAGARGTLIALSPLVVEASATP